MTDLSALLAELAALDIRLRLDDGVLRYSAPPGVFDEALKTRVRDRRDALIAHLAKPAPLSVGQERMWFLNRLEGTVGTYTEHLAYRLDGPLDRAALGRAIDIIVARHAVLRSRFANSADGPVQLPLDEAPALRLVTLADGDASLAGRLAEVAHEPFDLGSEAPVRFTLFALSPTRHVLSVAAHHAAWDGWSNGVFAEEVAEAYAAGRTNRPPALPALITDIATVAREERARLAAGAANPALERLVTACKDVPAILPLPFDRPRGSVADGRGAALPVTLPADVVEALKAAGRKDSASLYMVLLAGWALMLCRLTGLPKVLIGAPVAGREGSGEDALIGYLSNTVVFPIAVEGAESFGVLVARARNAVLAGLAAQSVPFEHLVETLAPPRSAATTPLVQTVLALQPSTVAVPAMDGLDVAVIPEGNEAARYELMLNLEPTADGGLAGPLIYATALLDEATVAGWLNHYRHILCGAPGAWTAALDATMPPAARTTVPATPDAPVSGTAALSTPDEAKAPRTDTERRLAALWGEFLQATTISREDDFFLLGGHSLLLMRLVNRIAESGLGTLSLGDALEHTRLSAMAAVLDRAPGTSDPDATAAATAGGDAVEESPVSLTQESLWLARRDDLDAPTWMVPMLVPLEPGTDPDLLRRVLVRLTARHPSLRTTFAERDGDVWQRVAPPPAAVPLEIREGLSGPARSAFLRQEIRRAFTLEAGPLYRFFLLRGAAPGAEDTLFIVADHIVIDGWSVGVLTRDIRALLTAEETGTNPALPALTTTPAVQARQARAALDGPDGKRLHAHWSKVLEGLELGEPPGTFGRRPPTADRRGRRILVDVPAATCDALGRIAGRAGTTPTVAFVAMVTTLLARAKGDGRDVSVATPFAGRPTPEMADLVGGYAEVLPLRLPGTVNRSLSDHLITTRKTVNAALAHQSFPLGRMIEILTRATGGTSTTLFDAVAIYEEGMTGQRDWFDPQTGADKYDLSFAWSSQPDGTALLTIEYDSWLYGDADARAFAARLLHLTETAATADAECPLSALSLLPDEERARVIDGFNQTTRPYPDDRTLAVLWRDAVDRHADQPAVRAPDGEVLTYATLDRRAGDLAARLAAHALGDPTVALAMDRGLPAIVATIAVLKIGAAYLPLDSKLPKATVRQLMDDTGARIVLADAPAVGRLGNLERSDLTLLRWADLTDKAASPAAPFQPPAVDAGAPAYIMFTSGSTGTPKGVVVPHRGVARLAFDRNVLPVGPGDVIPQAAPMGFDAATLEIWGALLNGATVAILDDSDLLDPQTLGATLARVGATVMWLTAGLFNRVTDACPQAFAPLRRLMTGGETLSPNHVARVKQALPQLELVNGYGPTENTCLTTTHLITEADLDDAIPIGRPIANSRVLVVDTELSPVPVGVWGELVCAGDGVALGYANRPDLTDAAFVTLPWGDRERVYRTGDFARWRHDGILEFGGRRDGQVKIRGHRIETTAIETVLRGDPGIHDAAVVITGEGAERLLVACLVADDPGAESAWRARIAEQLPAYMMPARFVPMDTLPVNTNGKVDRKALTRRMAEAAPVAVMAPVPVTSEAERLVADLFAQAFPGSRIDRDSDFMQLGGHSLMLMKLAARLTDATGVRLTLRALFAARTVAGMAALLTTETPAAAGGKAAEDAVPRLVPLADYPLSLGQERLVVMQRLYPDTGAYNVPLAFDVRGALDTAALERAFTALEQRHHALRLRVIDAPDQSLRQRLAEAGGLRPRMLDLRGRATADADATLQAEIVAPFRLETEAGARAVVARVADEHWRVMLVVHHALCDGWSVGILWRDLAALYGAETGGPPPPPAPARQFEEVAVWQRDQATGPEGQAILARQAARLTPLPPPLELPTDHRRPAVRAFRGGFLDHTFSAEDDRRLTALITEQRVPPLALATALVQVLLHRLSGQTDIALGTLVTPRERPELADTVGFLLNTLVLRGRVDGARSFRSQLDDAKALCLQAFDDQLCPFEAVVEAVDAPRLPGRNPLFDVLVVWQDDAPPPPSLAGLETSAAPIGFPYAKFDLSFHFGRKDGRLFCQIEYSRDLFEDHTAARLAGRLDALARAVVAEPDRPVEALDILPPAERTLVVDRFNDTAAPLAIDRTIPSPFLDQVAQGPERPALLHDGGPALDYRTFAARSAALAARLRDAGAGPGSVVALCLPRGPLMMDAIHGILLAGAAYAPLGTDQPAARLAGMLDDLKAPLVLVSDETTGLFAPGTPLLHLDSVELPTGDAAPAPCPAAPGDLAYVLFTSGSTGRPKGVEVEHRSVLNRILWMQDRFPIGHGDVVLQKTPVTFDVSVWELFWWSWAGAALALPPPGMEKDPQALAAFIGRHRVTIAHFVPSMLAAFLSYVEDGLIPTAGLASLRRVFVSGEALDVALVRRFNRLLHATNGTELHNLYGPTEATVDVTWQPCSPWDDDPVVPIGIPVANTRILILDPLGRPVPVGVPGEIHIGGVQVARGYRGRPDLTAERFIPDPVSGSGSGTLYRSGDLGRWRADGRIDYLGRIDQQVKVRGQRIEPGEVEAVLESHPAVDRAAVIAVTRDGLTDLHAYVLPRGAVDSSTLAATLATHATAHLAPAMVPARFFRLDALPLTSSGKLDRKALSGPPLDPVMPPAPTQPHLAQPALSEEAVQRDIRAIWASLLPDAAPGPDDGFFSVGGNSLLLIRLHQKLEARWPGVFTVTDLFATGTIADQTRRVMETMTPTPSPMPAPASEAAAPTPVAPAAPKRPDAASTAVAIVGLAVRLPGAETLADVWRDVSGGADLVRPLPASREADARALYAALGQPVPARFREGAYLDDVAGFDPRRYRLSPADATLIDPEQRLFLDVALRALEDGGRGGSALDGARVGVFVGASGPGVWRSAVMQAVEAGQVEQAFALTVPSNVATRLSFLHDWRGPASLVDTACSASLAAVHHACRALRAGDCDWALVGGSKVVAPVPGIGNRLTIDSSTGRTRAFDAGADGTGMGEGGVALLLRPLDKALAEGDPIHAVILGSAVNQDGASTGMAAPNPAAQAEVIRSAAADGGIPLASLSYIEAHGTGTALGDPIEVDGLGRAFGTDAKPGHAWIGAGKGNYGHLDGAAGVLGLARAVLCLAHDRAPPQPHFTAPNPKIAFDRAPVAVPGKLEPLPAHGGPRRAGVSAFGLSGINVHVVLEAAARRAPRMDSGLWLAVGLSASDTEALRPYADGVVKSMRAHPEWSLDDIARTLAEGRDALPARLATAVRDRGDLMARLATYAAAPEAAGDLVMTGQATGRQSNGQVSAIGPGEEAALAAARAFIAGDALVWPADDRRTGRAHLPGPALARRRLMPDLAAAASPVRADGPERAPAPAAHRLLGAPVITAEGTFHPLDVHAPDFWPVAEHRLDGEPTLVGMALPALATAALGPVRLKALRWSRPLRPAELHPGTVTLGLDAGGRVRLRGRTLDGDWRTFAEARLDPAADGTRDAPAPLTIAEIAGRCATPEAVAAPSADGPVAVSPRWHCLTRVAQGDGERLAWARSRMTADERESLPLDPALLDALTSLALTEPGLVPAGCDAIEITGPMPADVVAHAVYESGTEGVTATVRVADVRDSRVIATFRGLRFLRIVPPPQSTATIDSNAHVAADAELDDTRIDPSAPLWLEQANPNADPGGRILVIGAGPRAKRIAETLRTKGRLAGLCTASGTRASDIAGMMTGAPMDVIFAPEDGPDLGVRVVGAIRALLAAITTPTRLLAIGQGAVAVSVETARDPGHALTLGVALTAGLEEPMLTARYVDADDDTPVDALLAEMAAPEPPVLAVAWRGGKRLVRVFAALPDPGPGITEAATPPTWPDHGVCVVTGGTGGLALLLTETLAAGGKVALAMLSRNGRPAGADPDGQARADLLGRLESSGLDIRHYACDVTDRASLTAALADVRRTQGPITAVVHNAGVSSGGFVATSLETFDKELSTKVTGTRLLDELTRDDPLQAFIMAGSLTGLVGAPGFAAYMAGNAFEDGFAAYRCRQGRPGLTIDWCGIGEMGMAVRQLGTDLRGAWVDSHSAGPLFRHAVSADIPQVAMVTAEVRSLLVDQLVTKAHQNRSPANLVRTRTETVSSATTTAEVASAPDSKPKTGGLLETALASLWADVLGYDTIDPEDDFYALGGDSITAMRIVTRIIGELGMAVTLADMLDAGTVAALARHLGARMKAETPAARGPEPAPEADSYPVAWEQLAVLNAEAVGDRGTAYNLPHGLDLPAPLPAGMDDTRITAAITALVGRHEILRTRFLPAVQEDGEPTMRILPADTPVEIERLEVDDQDAADGMLPGWVRPFALYGGIPARFAIQSVAGRPVRVLVDVHHALADAFTLEALLADLAALLSGQTPPAPEAQFKDYAWWSRHGAEAPDVAEAAAYWRARFEILPPPLDLPADRPRSTRPDRRVGTVELPLSRATMDALRACAATRRTTSFVLVTTAWFELLRRYGRVDDLVIAVPVDSRTRDGFAGMLGMMVSLLPLRHTTRHGEQVGDLVERVKVTCSDALRHRAFGLGRLLTELAPPVQPGRTPLADITLSYMNFAPNEGTGEMTPFGLTRPEGKGDLGLFVRDVPDSMIVACEYAEDLFDRDRIDRMLRHFETLLAALVTAASDSPVDTLPLIDAQELDALSALEWGPKPALDKDRGLYGTILDIARRNPDAPAVSGPDGRTTYAGLVRRSAAIAEALVAAGVRPGDRVVLHVERNAGAVVLLLGICAAGATYVPLDPAFPEDRIRWLLEDTAGTLAIADAAGRAVLDGHLPVLDAAGLLTTPLDGSPDMPAPVVPEPPADTPAYVLYTSGSTGRPKGVVVPRQAIPRLARGDGALSIGPDDKVMQTGPLAFDASTFEIWGALLNGAELCVLPREDLLDPDRLAAAFARHGATIAWLTAGLFNRQVDAAPDTFRGMRTVLAGGEALSPSHLRKAMAAAPDVTFVNGYGPTENTTFSTTHVIRPEDVRPGPVPIGVPLAHSRVSILEPGGQPAPIGVWGEIAVGGLGLAEGYLGRPDLTAERFRDDPRFPGQRLYWTGDLGRWRADGVVEFGGRVDTQIKLRGYRIELEEIERTLADHLAVADVAVLHLPEGAGGVGELVACVRLAAGQSRAIDELRPWLSARLPAYMVPRRFVACETLPITGNGKVDRAQLRAGLPADDGADGGEAPRPGTERVVADILAALFSRPVEDRHAGFSELGGHSLLAIRAVNRIAEETGVRLSIGDFLTAETVIALAALIDGAADREDPIPPAPPAEHYPASHAQTRLYLTHHLDTESSAYNIALALRAATVNTDALAEALHRLTLDHAPLRTALLDIDGAIRQRIDDDGHPTVAVVDLSAEADPAAEALRQARRETALPFDLAAPPLLRARAINLGADGWLVLLVLHHVVGDGWSTRIVLRDLERHYADVTNGVAFTPTIWPVTYRDYAVWQTGRDWSEATAYWRRTLDGAPGSIALPTDRPPPPVQSHRGDTVARTLPPTIAGGLAAYAREKGTTMAVVGLALFSSLLYRLGRQGDLVIGMGVAGRDRSQLEGLVGFFVNLLPIRLRMDDETEVDALVEQTRAAVIGAMEYRDYPFDRLVRDVAPQRRANRQPLVNVVFEYQRFEELGADMTVGGEGASAFGGGGLREDGLGAAFMADVEDAIRPATAKHDLLLFLIERRDRTEVVLEFDTDIFDRATAERWLAYLERFATMVANRPIPEVAE